MARGRAKEERAKPPARSPQRPASARCHTRVREPFCSACEERKYLKARLIADNEMLTKQHDYMKRITKTQKHEIESLKRDKERAIEECRKEAEVARERTEAHARTVRELALERNEHRLILQTVETKDRLGEKVESENAQLIEEISRLRAERDRFESATRENENEIGDLRELIWREREEADSEKEYLRRDLAWANAEMLQLQQDLESARRKIWLREEELRLRGITLSIISPQAHQAPFGPDKISPQAHQNLFGLDKISPQAQQTPFGLDKISPQAHQTPFGLDKASPRSPPLTVERAYSARAEPRYRRPHRDASETTPRSDCLDQVDRIRIERTRLREDIRKDKRPAASPKFMRCSEDPDARSERYREVHRSPYASVEALPIVRTSPDMNGAPSLSIPRCR